MYKRSKRSRSVGAPLTLMIVLVAALGCASIPARLPHTLHPRSTFFSDAQTSRFLHLFAHCGGGPRGTLSGTWTPTYDQVADADRRVRATLASSFESDSPLNLDLFYIQYFGLIDNGQRVLFVNGVHEVAARGSPDAQWLSAPLVICDIGRAGFQAEYELSTRQVGMIRFAEAYTATPEEPLLH